MRYLAAAILWISGCLMGFSIVYEGETIGPWCLASFATVAIGGFMLGEAR